MKPTPETPEDPTTRPDVAELARAAYHAYNQHSGWKNFEGKPCPRWEDLPEAVRQHWGAAVIMVESELALRLARRFALPLGPTDPAPGFEVESFDPGDGKGLLWEVELAGLGNYDDEAAAARATWEAAGRILAIVLAEGAELPGGVDPRTHALVMDAEARAKRAHELADASAQRAIALEASLETLRAELPAIREELAEIRGEVGPGAIEDPAAGGVVVEETLVEVDDDIAPATIVDLLGLVCDGQGPELATVEGWTREQQLEAARWGASVHVYASDGLVVVPPRPAFLPREDDGQRADRQTAELLGPPGVGIDLGFDPPSTWVPPGAAEPPPRRTSDDIARDVTAGKLTTGQALEELARQRAEDADAGLGEPDATIIGLEGGSFSGEFGDGGRDA